MMIVIVSALIASWTHDAVREANCGAQYRSAGSTLLAEQSLLRASALWRRAGMQESANGLRTDLLLAGLYAAKGAMEKAEPLADHAWQCLRSNPQSLARDRAFALATLGSVRRSEKLYRQALALEPDAGAIWNNLGVFLKSEGRLTEAEQCYREALRRDPRSPAALVNLAIVEQQNGSFEAAEQNFLEALGIAPAGTSVRATALAGYSELLRQEGRKREAKRYQQRARDLQARLDLENQRGLTVSIESLKASGTSRGTSRWRRKLPPSDDASENRGSHPGR